MTNLTTYARLISRDIEIRYVPGIQGQNRWRARLNFVGIRESPEGSLISIDGCGDTPEDAMHDYVAKIRGKILVRGDEETRIPTNLTGFIF